MHCRQVAIVWEEKWCPRVGISPRESETENISCKCIGEMSHTCH